MKFDAARQFPININKNYHLFIVLVKYNSISPKLQVTLFVVLIYLARLQKLPKFDNENGSEMQNTLSNRCKRYSIIDQLQPRQPLNIQQQKSNPQRSSIPDRTRNQRCDGISAQNPPTNRRN